MKCSKVVFPNCTNSELVKDKKMKSSGKPDIQSLPSQSQAKCRSSSVCPQPVSLKLLLMRDWQSWLWPQLGDIWQDVFSWTNCGAGLKLMIQKPWAWGSMTVMAICIHGQNLQNCCGQDLIRHSVSSFLLNTHDEQGVALSATLCIIPGDGFQEGTALASRVFHRPSIHIRNMQYNQFIFSFGKWTSQEAEEHFFFLEKHCIRRSLDPQANPQNFLWPKICLKYNGNSTIEPKCYV